MSEKLKHLDHVDKNRPDVRGTLPETKEQAWQAAQNREKVAKLTKESAQVVDKTLLNAGDSMLVSLGTSNKDEKLEGSVEKVSKAGLLRVKIMINGQAEASFVYHGLIFGEPGDKPQLGVIQEVPDATGPDVHPLSHDAGSPKDLRSLALNFGGNGHVYSDENAVEDLGAMDYLITTQVLTTAAEQVKAEKAELSKAV